MKIFLLILCCFTLSVHAGTIGSVVKVAGSVFKNKDHKMNYGDSIAEGDSISTREKSFLTVKMIDGSLFTFSPKTDFSFKSMIFVATKDRSMNFELHQGKMRGLVSKSQSSKNDVNIQTKAVTMGIRGTEILLNHNNEEGKEFTEAALLEGVAEIKYKNSGLVYQLKPGDYLVAGHSIKQLSLDKSKYEALASMGTKVYKRYELIDKGEILVAASKDDKGESEKDPELTEEYFLSGPGLAALEQVQQKEIKSQLNKLRERSYRRK